MNKKEFINRVSDTLKENGIKKPISVRKNTFKIVSEDGDESSFTVKRQDKNVIYTLNDITNIIDACVLVAEDAIKNGDDIVIHGFGSLGVHYRAPRRSKDPHAGEWYDVEGRYVPKFNPGANLKMAARVYGLALQDREKANYIPPLPSENEGDT